MKKIIFLGFMILVSSSFGFCGQTSKIELSDGSVINGEIVSFSNGVYTIKNPVFGEMQIGQAKVSKIESTITAAPASKDNPAIPIDSLTPDKIESYRKKVMSNPESVAAINNLASNPQLQDLANDPEIAKAAKAGDVQTLLKNAKFMNIVNDPNIQETVRKLKKQNE